MILHVQSSELPLAPHPSRLDDLALADPTLNQMSDVSAAYLLSTERDLPELDRALARGDVAKVAAMAKRLKQAAVVVGARPMCRAAERIEACFEEGMLERLPYEVASLRQAQGDAAKSSSINPR